MPTPAKQKNAPKQKTSKAVRTRSSVQDSKPKTSPPAPRSPKIIAVYKEAVGRRKTAVARVRSIAGLKNVFVVNGKTVEEYFGTPGLRAIATAPIYREGFSRKYAISVKVSGGGIHSQAEAIRHGLSRILVSEDTTQKKELKKMGFLKRDSRKVERKHFGYKKARKASQWKKR